MSVSTQRKGPEGTGEHAAQWRCRVQEAMKTLSKPHMLQIVEEELGARSGEPGEHAARAVRDILKVDPRLAKYMLKLDSLLEEGNLVNTLVKPADEGGYTLDEQESNLREHITCALAAIRAHAAGVATEHDFLYADLRTLVPASVWRLILEARTLWRPTVAVQQGAEDDGAVAEGTDTRDVTAVLLTYLVPLNAGPAEMREAVSPTHNTAMPAPPHTPTPRVLHRCMFAHRRTKRRHVGV